MVEGRALAMGSALGSLRDSFLAFLKGLAAQEESHPEHRRGLDNSQ
jgi:hypothetical protein